jgi:signal transduction histidine kinase
MGQENPPVEITLLRSDGTTLSVESTSIPIMLQGQPATLIIGQDITERKRAEEQIKNQNILLKKAVQEKQREMEALFERLLRQEKLATIGQMASSIAHELRNPLGAVKNSVFFLKRLYHNQHLDTSNPSVEEHLNLIETELNTSERVIADLLQMIRMKPPQREQTDLGPIIEDAVKHCHFPKGVQCIIELQPESFLISADPIQLRQVFVNLLTNAIQAITGDGSITIRAKQVPEDQSCVIEVEDTGTGIEYDTLDNVFEPLYTTKAAGTGLGLSICKQIIENHQGQISVKSRVGQGTTVTILLPEQKTIR